MQKSILVYVADLVPDYLNTERDTSVNGSSNQQLVLELSNINARTKTKHNTQYKTQSATKNPDLVSISSTIMLHIVHFFVL